MFGPLGLPEVIFLLLLALLIFGPRKLPELGRTLGKGLSEFRKASTELKRTFNSEIEDLKEADPRRILRDDPPKRPQPQRRLPDPKPAAEEPERHEPPQDTASAGEKETGEKKTDDGRVARGADLEKTPAPADGGSEERRDSEEHEVP